MTHAAGLQVGTVVQATLLPTETAGNAAGTAALTTANATQATHVSEGRRTRAAEAWPVDTAIGSGTRADHMERGRACGDRAPALEPALAVL